MFMNNIETLTPSTFICLPKVTVLWLMIISLFLLQFYNIYNIYVLFIFRPCANYGVPCIITSICWTSHCIISANVRHRHCCYLWYVNKIITHFFKVSFFFFGLPKSKSHVNHFRVIFFPLLLIIHASVNQCYENIWYKEIDSSHFFLSLCWFLCRL